MTGAKVAALGLKNNPVSWAYQYNLQTYAGKPVDNRHSWDQTAVLCAIRNPEKYFYVNGPGTFIINKDGSNSWNPDIDRGHYFLVHKYPYGKIAEVIDQLMIHSPQ
jgi:hypothetical protein